MQTAPEIDFLDMEPRPELRAKIEGKLAQLEKLYGRMTACRVVAKGPGGGHHTGGHYEFSIHIALPDGREVTVERTPDPDERFQDPDFALNDAFKRARRQLQDQTERIRGEIKHHEAEPVAVVKSVFRADGFGFLESEDGRDIYFHRNSVEAPGFDALEIGERVAFLEEQGAEGPQARLVRPRKEIAPTHR